MNKVKNSLLIISITYMVMVICLMSYSYLTSEKYIFLEPSENIEEDLNPFKERINKVEESSCKEYFNDFINYIDKTCSKEKLLIKEYYNDVYLNEEYVLSYALKGEEACSQINEESFKELGIYFLSASVAEDSQLNYYVFQYELRIPDVYNRVILEPSTISVNNMVKYRNLIKILDLELKMVENGGLDNEI